MSAFDGDVFTKLGAGIAALGAGVYGVLRLFKSDRRQDKVYAMHDDAIEQVIKTLREEVERLTKRLELVEEQNRKCEERNDAMHFEIIELKKQLHLA